MFDALHPNNSTIMSVEEYREFVLNANYRFINEAPSARCPICERDMKVRAGQHQDNAHFYHNDNLPCPTKDPSARPYLRLMPTQPDPVIMRRNREFAEGYITHIYRRVSTLVPYIDLKEFVALLREARRLNIYGYANIEPEYLPYIYVTLMNFLPSTSHKKLRQLKFCFFYRSEIQTFEQLWVDRGPSSDLYRVSYHKSVTQKVARMETTKDYLKEAPSVLSVKQIEWCLAVI